MHIVGRCPKSPIPRALLASFHRYECFTLGPKQQHAASLKPDSRIPMKYSGMSEPSGINQSLLLYGYQQQHEQLHASSVAAVGARSSMLYGEGLSNPAHTATTTYTHAGRSATAAMITTHQANCQHGRIPVQQQVPPQHALGQQMLLGAQGCSQQQLQQAAVAATWQVAEAAAGASSTTLLGYHYVSSQHNYTTPATSYSSQQQQVMPAILTGLPQCPASTSCHFGGSLPGWSDQSTASSSNLDAQSALFNMHKQQCVSFDPYRTVSSSASSLATANTGSMLQQFSSNQQAAPVDLHKTLSGASTPTVGLVCDEDMLSWEVAEHKQQSGGTTTAVLAAITTSQINPGSFTDLSSTSYCSMLSAGSRHDVSTEEDQKQSHLCRKQPIHVRYPTAAGTTPTLVSTRAAAAQETAAARHSKMLQMVQRTADMRKGTAVLTASAARAAAAGAESVRCRLLISEVSVYTERGANSMMALDQANKLLSKMTLPDGVTYMPISPESLLFKAGTVLNFPAFVICLGSSYLQRMFARRPQLAKAVMVGPGFEAYCQPEYLPERFYNQSSRQFSGPEAAALQATLRSIQFTCLFLASKVADQAQGLGFLRFMLNDIINDEAGVTIKQAANMEARCLATLDWRLGPFFLEDDLSGDDVELWAGSMGHWNYGGDRDSYPGISA